jgi:hypothetical protein
VFDRNDADLKIITYNGTPGPGASLLGRASPPGEESEGQMEYNAGDERYNEAGLTQAASSSPRCCTSSAMPRSVAPARQWRQSSIMRGAGGGTAGIGGAYGDFRLSQGVFTVMSYNDGWDLGPRTAPPPGRRRRQWLGRHALAARHRRHPGQVRRQRRD